MMFLAAAIGGLGLVGLILADLLRAYAPVRALLSPMAYFSILWWIGFPFHALLLANGWVDTMQVLNLTQSDLLGAVALSAFFVTLIWYTERKGRQTSLVEQRAFLRQWIREHCVLPRAIVLEIILIGTAAFFLNSIIWSEEGNFSPFTGNDQNVARVGNGPLFILSILFVYGLVALLPILSDRSKRTYPRIITLLVFLIGLGVAVVVMATLTTRSVVFLPVFAALLAWLTTRSRPSAWLAALLILATIALAPAMQTARYYIVGKMTPTAQPTQTTSPVKGSPTTNVHNTLPPYCQITDQGLVPQHHLKVWNNAIEQKDTRPSYAQWVSTYLCDPDNYLTYFSTQTLAVTYGLADHVATYIQKVTPTEFLTGIDHGTAWTYNIALGLIPRSIWREKPLHYGSVAEQKWLYPDMYAQQAVTMTLPPSFVVDFMFGFGLLGAIPLALGLGWSFAKIHQLLWETQRSTTGFAFALFVMAFLYNVARGGTSFLQAVIEMVVVIALFYWVPGPRLIFWKKRTSPQ